MRAHENGYGRDSEVSLARDLRTLSQAFSCRWKLIAAIMAAFLLIGLAFIWVSKPSYISSADIFIDPRERNIVDLNVAPSGLGSSSQGADGALLESQIAILRSRAVLERLIERENLLNEPEFYGGPSGGISGLVKGLVKMLIYGPNASDYNQATPIDQVLQKLGQAVQVARVDQTYMLNVAVTTGDAKLSARLANALAEIYLAEGQNAVNEGALEAARSLESRLAELQKASDASQRAVEDYRRENGLFGSQGVLTDERQMSDLSIRIVNAEIATKAARAARDEIRRGGISETDTLLSSELTTQLRMQLDRARSEENTLAGIYGARHPRFVQAAQNRAALEKALAAELARLSARAESEYQKASDTEQALKALMTQYREQVAGSSAASVKLRELEQAASRDRALYETFATRAKQAREQIALPTTSVRIISPAQPSSRPAGPKVAIVLAASLFLGLVTGLGTAWLLYLLRGMPRRKDWETELEERYAPLPVRAAARSRW